MAGRTGGLCSSPMGYLSVLDGREISFQCIPQSLLLDDLSGIQHDESAACPQQGACVQRQMGVLPGFVHRAEQVGERGMGLDDERALRIPAVVDQKPHPVFVRRRRAIALDVMPHPLEEADAGRFGVLLLQTVQRRLGRRAVALQLVGELVHAVGEPLSFPDRNQQDFRTVRFLEVVGVQDVLQHAGILTELLCHAAHR